MGCFTLCVIVNKVLQGCVLDLLPTLPEGIARACVTSPPYWGLRDYGVDGQMGLEDTPEAWVEQMVKVFREVWRVLTPDATLWLNMGDAYAADKPKAAYGDMSEAWKQETGDEGGKRLNRGNAFRQMGLKQKDLIGQPWLLAFALRADGWYLRSDIIWHKPNPMPESVTDRPTKAHEYLFLFSKSPKYYYDGEAIKEPISAKTLTVSTTPIKGSGIESTGEKLNQWMADNGGRYHPDKANKRSVWTVPSAPYPEAHFATFPPKLIEPCILAGSEVGDIVLDPFMGSGTTAQVAQNLGRQWVGCELNPEYVRLIESRTAQQAMAL